MDALEAKVRDLERASRVQYNRPDIPNPSPLAIAGTPGQEGGSNDGQSGFHARNGVADGSPASSSHKPQRRYGKSTSLHFALNVKASATAMPEDVGGVEGGTSPNGDAEDAGDGEEEEEEEEWLVEYTSPSPGMSQLLPHRHTAKALFDKYFEVVHPIWPFLLESESRDLFAQTWTSDDPPEPLWMVQLNLIMCLGCQQYESETDGTDTISRSDATSSGKDFYQRAQGYVYANAFTTSNAGMLQALLLMALYQQGAMRFREFYLTVGHAARIAQSLGLHISRPESGPVEPQQREVRRRLWWGCFCTDR